MINGDIRKWLAVGTGIGIEVRGDDLEVTVARVRPQEVRILAATTITGFESRPAGEWGAEYGRLLEARGASHLAATVLLPRSEIIVRQLSLPGVGRRDAGAAIRLQVDSLHPYPENEAVHGWARIPGGSQVLVGIARTETIERYTLLFAEAGIRVASFTFSAPVIHSALRLHGNPPEGGFLLFEESENGLEAYGESPARPIFSATFDMPAEQAVRLAGAELRTEDELEPERLSSLLPQPASMPEDYDSGSRSFSYATALAGACPWLSIEANLLPASERSSSSRKVYLPTGALAAMLLIALSALAVYSGSVDDSYLEALNAEVASLTPRAGQVRDIETSSEGLVARRNQLIEFRGHTKADLDSVLELTRILEPPVWTRQFRLTRSTAQFAGEAPQAAPLLEVIDNSPLFRNSQFVNPMSKVGDAESFSIRAERETPSPGDAQ
ncbi:MAG: hypothetical protein GY953_53920 [bacterium]|nr:hypothetical protein [bacterium]